MRVLVISDIHANLTALDTVLEDAEGQWEFLWCLGDLVGYGPDPNECVARVREFDHLSLRGNHDLAALDELDIRDFNEDAQAAVRWTQDQLSVETRAYLQELPARHDFKENPFTLAHGSPRMPALEYILDEDIAADNLPFFKTPYCLVGHTHVPVLYVQEVPHKMIGYRPVYDELIELNGARLIINPGSVGQPRDMDPRAAYALLDLTKMTWEFRRVYYPYHKTQERMFDAGLPPHLIARLQLGI